MGRTLLLAMPCAPVERPPLGLNLLRAGLERAGEPCDIRYPNLAFAQLLSPSLYHLLVFDFPRASLVGEWVFAPALFQLPTPTRTTSS